MADLLAAGIRLATHHARQDLASAAGTTATPGFVPIVGGRSGGNGGNARRLGRRGSRSSSPVRWFGRAPGIEDAAQLTAVLRFGARRPSDHDQRNLPAGARVFALATRPDQTSARVHTPLAVLAQEVLAEDLSLAR